MKVVLLFNSKTKRILTNVTRKICKVSSSIIPDEHFIGCEETVIYTLITLIISSEES